jgi:N-acetylmuramoyl-L-alanine amidase
MIDESRRVRSQARVSIGLLLFLSSLVPCLSFSQPYDWERRLEEKAKKIGGDFLYVPLQEIANLFDVHVYYSNKVHKAILYFEQNKITVSAFNPFVVAGHRVHQMPVEAGYANGDILLPVKFFIPILRDALGESFPVLYDSRSPVVSDPSAYYNVASVEVEDKANGTMIRIKTTVNFAESSISTRYSRQWFYIDILGGRYDTTYTKPVNSRFIRAFQSIQSPQVVQLGFQLKASVISKDVTVTRRPNEIWVTLPSKERVGEELIAKLQDERELWSIDRIVIDPGHGGRDPGTSGPTGVKEKDVVLAISKKLKELINRRMPDVEVFLTREGDTYPTLSERAQLANQKEAKLFICIHANWNVSSRARGAETYFLGPHKSEESIEVAQRENSVINHFENAADYEELTEEKLILATMAQNQYIHESQDLAAIFQDKIREKTGLKDRGVKQAGFQVLWQASMTNVFVETGFLSNPSEEKLLNSPDFQMKMAEAILEGIKEFKKKYEVTMR